MEGAKGQNDDEADVAGAGAFDPDGQGHDGSGIEAQGPATADASCKGTNAVADRAFVRGMIDAPPDDEEILGGMGSDECDETGHRLHRDNQ